MSLRNDNRGITPQIGFILIFGILVVLMSIYQAQVVPAQNQNVEYRHSQDVQSDMVKVQSALLSSAASGTSYSATVTLGTRYPTRVFFVNPAPVTGTLKTKAFENNLTISHVKVPYNNETNQYWDSNETHSYQTEPLVYETNYVYYDNAPSQIVYQNTGVYSNYSDANATIIESKPILIQDNTITIITLTGNLSRNGLQTTAITPRVLSGPYHEVHITNDKNENITISLPTMLPPKRAKKKWSSILGPNVSVTNPNPSSDRIVLTLKQGNYTLQMAKLGVGAGLEQTDAAYLTTDMKQNLSISPGEEIWLEVQVRDKFNNPQAGTQVNFTRDGEIVRNDTSDDDGSAAVRYSAPEEPDTDTIWVNATIKNGDRYEEVSFKLNISGKNDAKPISSIDDVTDNSQCRGNQCQGKDRAEFSVEWSASDDNELASVTIQLKDSGNVVQSKSPSVSGKTASGSVTLTDPGGYSNEYTIVVIATDSSQQSTSTSEVHVADGDSTGSPP